MAGLDYIECDGVRVPSNWTIERLRNALAKRKIRFSNEQEIIGVFGDAVQLKYSLEERIHFLRTQVAELNDYINRKRQLASCPVCGLKWAEDPIVSNAKK